MGSTENTFFKIFKDRYGSIIIGLILKNINRIILGADSRSTGLDGSLMLDDNDEEHKIEKIYMGEYYAMAMCGQLGFAMELAIDTLKSKKVRNSLKLAGSIMKRMHKKARSLPVDMMDSANCGLLLAMFDYEGRKPIPKLMGIELEVVNSVPLFKKSDFGRYGFDGSHYDELTKFLRDKYRPWLSLEDGIALVRQALNIVKGTSVRSGGYDSVGGYMSVWDMAPASPQERSDGILINITERTHDQLIVPADAPTYSSRRRRCGKRKRRSWRRA